MKNTAMHKCYYLVQPTDMREKLNMELFCKFGKAKVTVPSPPWLTIQGRFLFKGGGVHYTQKHPKKVNFFPSYNITNRNLCCEKD